MRKNGFQVFKGDFPDIPIDRVGMLANEALWFFNLGRVRDERKLEKPALVIGIICWAKSESKKHYWER
ncbi:MAG: hypothetical protein AB7U05_04090 [Mangrovibacterium sp.]